MGSENDKDSGASDTSKKGEPSKLHIASGDRQAFVAPETPKAAEHQPNTGGPAEAVKNPTHEATKLHVADGDRQKADIAGVKATERKAPELRASEVPKVEHSRENAGGPAAPVKAPAPRSTDLHVAKGERQANKAGAVPTGPERTKNEGGPTKTVEKAKAAPAPAAPPPERAARQPAVMPKTPAASKNTGPAAAAAAPARPPATRVSTVAKRSDRNLSPAVKQAVGAAVMAGAVAAGAAIAAKAGSFKPPSLPGFLNPALAALSSSMTKLSLTPEKGTAIAFVYNPTQFSLDRAVSWEDSRAMKEPYGILSFTGGSSDTLNFTAMVDRTEEEGKDVFDDVKNLYEYTKVAVQEKNYARPPIVTLSWGKIKFVGVVTAVKADFVMFSASGNPLRANVTITMMGRAFSDANQATKFFAPFTKV